MKAHLSAARLPSLRLLAGFEAAARHGSFARAAEELSLSQSAISHQIQQLEEQLAQPLFRRVGRGVELTVAGEILLRSVQRSLQALQSGLGRIATYLDPGLVVLVCPAPVLHGWLQPRLERLCADLPGLLPLFSTDETARFIDEIDVDLTIFSAPLQQPGLVDLPLFSDEWIVLAAPALAARLQDLAPGEHPQHAELLCLEEGFTRDETAALHRGPLGRFRMRAIYDDARLLLDSARRGLGITCLPRLLAADALRQGELAILPDYPSAPGCRYWLSRVAGAPRSAIVGQFADWLQREAGGGS